MNQPDFQVECGKSQGTQGATPLPTHLQVFSQTRPLLYSSVPSQQSEVEVRAKIREGRVSSSRPLPPSQDPQSTLTYHTPHR